MNVEEYENKIDIYMFVSVDMLLKAQDVTELPYIKGMLEKVNINGSKMKTALMTENNLVNSIKSENSSILSDAQVSAVVQEINYVTNSVKQYIGTVSDTNFYLKVTADLDNNGLVIEDTVKIYVENVEGEYEPIELVFPKSQSEMKNEGAEFVSFCIENADELKLLNDANRNSNDANVEKMIARSTSAVNYMLTYTSNPTVCECNNSSCSSIQDSSKWNNAAYPYNASIFLHSDCADYVSQALYESGIPTSGNWTVRSSAWVSASALVNHMVDRGIFVQASASEPITGGSVIHMPGHIVMITYADTVSLKYSGHTRDRKNAVYISKSNYTEYNLW